MTRGLYPKTALALACVGLGLALPACSSDDSGQTGSPNHDSTEYESPAPVEPIGGGSESNGDQGGRPIVAQPIPMPSPAAVVESALLVGGPRLNLIDVDTPNEPALLGRLETAGETQILSAASLDRIVLLVTGGPRHSSETLPGEAIPSREQRVLEVDASDPSAPQLSSTSFIAPGSTQAVVDLGSGYALLGGEYAAREPECGNLAEIERPPPPLESTWIRLYSRSGELDAQRSFGPSSFVVSSDRRYLVRLATDAEGNAGDNAAIELIELATLDTALTASVDARDFTGTFGADHAGGRLLLAGGHRVYGWDVASGSALEPLATSSPIGAIRAVAGTELATLSGGGNGLVRVTSGALELVAIPSGGTALEASDALQPFGDGFIALGGVGLASSPHAVAKRYALDETGALSFVDEVVTDWYYWAARTFHVDAVAERVTYTLPVDDTDRGKVGMIAAIDGTLRASSLAEMHVFDPAPRSVGNALLAISAHSVQSIEVNVDAADPSLDPGEVVITGLESVRAELAHAGLLFTLHRTDTGLTSLRYRADEYALATELALPHAANALVPIDDTHVMVLGLSQTGQCEQLLEEYGDRFSECSIDKPNGASLLAVDGGEVSLAGTLELTNDLLPATAEGAEQWLDWSGFLTLGNGSLSLLGSRSEFCTTEAMCDAIGAVAYPAGSGAPGSCGSEACETDPEPWPEVSGSKRQSVLVTLSVAASGSPELGELVLGGARNDINEVYEYNVAHAFLADEAEGGAPRAYTVQESVYDEEGNGTVDSHGQALARHYVQFVEVEQGAASFGEKVNVPGEAVLLAGPSATLAGTGRAVFTLEPAYRSDDSPTTRLVRSRVEDGEAHVEESVDVGPYVTAEPTSGGKLALLSLPADACESETRYELRIADLGAAGISLSDPLVLSGGDGSGFSLTGYPPESAEDGKVHLFGGPAWNGRLTVDITTNPPSITAYETR